MRALAAWRGVWGCLGQFADSFPGGGLFQADRVAGGVDDVGVVHQPVDRGCGQGGWHELVKP